MPSLSISLGLAAALCAPPAGETSTPDRPTPPEEGPAPPGPDAPPAEDGAAEASPAESQPAEGEPTATEPAAETGAAAGGSASASGPTATAGRQYSARGPEDNAGDETEPVEEREDKWIHRYPPTNGMAEFGAFGGVWFPSRRLELFVPEEGHQFLRRAAPEIGLRAGYYPIRFFGVEVEGAVIPTRTQGTDGRATAWALRANVIGQLGLWSVTPFLLAGTGVLGMSSPSGPEGIGNDQDVAIQLGGGVKVFINHHIQLRLDIRDVISNRLGVGEGLTSSPEILLGVTFNLRRRKQEQVKEPEPPPPTPDNDRDGDTVIDEEDYCPDVYGVPPRGCPQVCLDDNDADGLPNPEDQCPEDPENRNGYEDDDGCPDEIPPELDEIAGVMEGIFFDNDKDIIKRGSQPVLDNAVDVLTRFPKIHVKIIGHTSSTGGYRHNIDLSQRRAKSVRDYLVSHGIDTERLETDGVGPDQPIASNETKEGQAKNRRIEFKIISQ